MEIFKVLGYLDTTIFIGMLIGLVVISKICGGKQDSAAKDFATGGKNLGIVIVVGSCVATYMGAYTGGGHCEIVMSSGLVALTIICGCNIGWIILTLMAGPLRMSGSDTAAEFIRKKYDISTQKAVSAMSILKCIASLAGQFIATGTLFTVLGLGTKNEGIIFSGIIIMILTILGGLKGIAVTNIIQAMFIAVICCFVIPAMSLGKVGGLGTMLANTPPEMKSFISGPGLGWPAAFALFLSTTLSFAAEPAMIQRILSAKNTRTAVKSSIISNITSFILVVPLTFGAMCCSKIFPGLDTGAKYFPEFIIVYLPPVLKGLALFSFISLFLTTGDAYLHTGASSFLVDFARTAHPDMSDKKALSYTRLTIILMSVIAVLFSLWGGQIYKVMLIGGGAYGAAVVFPTLMACFSKRKIDYRYVNAAIYIAAAVTLLWEFFFKESTGIAGCFIGLAINIILCMLHSGPGITKT